MRDDLRPHGHTKTGDGGNIDGIDTDSNGDPYVSGTDDDGNSVLDGAASGGPTAVASGTTTANDGTTREFLNIPLNGNYTISGYPSNYDTSTSLAVGTDEGGDAVWLEYATAGDYVDISEDAWSVVVDRLGASDLTVEWTVFEL